MTPKTERFHSIDFKLYTKFLFVLHFTASAYGICDIGWNEYNNKCYQPFAASDVRPGYMFLQDAINTCSALNAGLPSIHSHADERFLISQLRIVQQTSSAPGLWLGGRITSVENLTPIWSDNSRSDFTNFNSNAVYAGYFRLFPTYRCLAILDPNTIGGEGTWDIGNCESSGTPYGVVCVRNQN